MALAGGCSPQLSTLHTGKAVPGFPPALAVPRLLCCVGRGWSCPSSRRDSVPTTPTPRNARVTQISWRCSYLILPSALSAAALEELPSALPQPAGLSCGSHTLGELGKPREGWGAMAQPGLHCQGLGGQDRSVPPAQLLLQGKATVSWAWPSNPAKQSWETPAELSAQP